MTEPEQLTPERLAQIRDLNDRLRACCDPIAAMVINGSIVFTRTLIDRGDTFVSHALNAMRTFADFSEDNDPWGEHDCAVMTVDGETVIWKIDYYSPDMQHASATPWDAGRTRRVLTLMLGEDY